VPAHQPRRCSAGVQAHRHSFDNTELHFPNYCSCLQYL